MKIRSITAFVSPKRLLDDKTLAPVAALIEKAKAVYTGAGYEVQTVRLATTPFPQWIKPLSQSQAVEAAVGAEAMAAKHGFAYIALGPALPELSETYSFIPHMLAATKTVFFSAVIANKKDGISMWAVRSSSEVIRRAATLEANGFANLRFAALANVPAGSPFFPAAYHRGSKPAFAIATQSADLAVQAFSDARTIGEGSRALTESIRQHGVRLARVGKKLSTESGVAFGGVDFSLAPFPEDSESLGTAFERMGLSAVGAHGSLAAAAILTQAIDAAKFQRAGFNGLLMPPLEDAALARRAADGQLSIQDLLSYSAVCGTGLDTVPLPGDSKPEEMSALLLDLAALALRLDKPLTARLMPIPGKHAGDMTEFDFAFFANTRVMELKSGSLSGPLAESENIRIQPRGNAAK
jgi:uncharacterized protein (UPF0210 family)